MPDWLVKHSVFDLPAGLAVLYVLNSCTQSLPLTANTGFLNTDLEMPQATQSLYYAVTFMPWSLKPLYGLVADMVPVRGYHFTPWLAISSLGSALCYLAMATLVHTIGDAFWVALLRAMCNAFAELMLGAILVSYARCGGGGSATTLQAAAVSCRFAGTVFAALVGLLIYPCGVHQHRLSNRAVIGLTAIFPASVALLSFLLPEQRDAATEQPAATQSVTPPTAGVDLVAETKLAAKHKVAILFILVLPLQAAVLWGQACSRTSCVLVSPEAWLTTLYVLLVTALLLPAAVGLSYLYLSCSHTWRQDLWLRGLAADHPALLQHANPNGSSDGLPVASDGDECSARPVSAATDEQTVSSGKRVAPPMAPPMAQPASTDAGPNIETAMMDVPIMEPLEASPMSAHVAVVVLLLLTVTPSGSIQASSFQYSLFSGAELLCELQVRSHPLPTSLALAAPFSDLAPFSHPPLNGSPQYLSLMSYAASIAASVAFGRVFKRQPLRRIVLAGGLLAAITSLSGIALPSLCAHAPIPAPSAPPFPPVMPPMPPAAPPSPPQLPVVHSAPPPPPSYPSPPSPPPMPQPCNMDTAFAVAAASSILSGLFSEIGFLPKLVVATQVAANFADSASGVGFGGAQPYAVMLTVIDMGDAISLQITAPIVSALGISYSDFSALPSLVGIGAASSMVVLLGLGLAWFHPTQAGRQRTTLSERVEAGDI